MLWRHLCLARALAASALLTGSMVGPALAGEPTATAPADDAAETVRVLDAQKAGRLAVDARGHGQSEVRISLRNTTQRRLNVVLPPGLVASSAVGQGPGGGAGGGGGGGGFQSMGLGAMTNDAGGFGQFAGNGAGAEPGFRSIPAAPAATTPLGAIAVEPGQKADVDIPAVCLNFGLPTPGARNKFRLVDVDDYSKDARVRRALRSLATLGTSRGTAQAAMWKVCNDIPFQTMLEQAGKLINPAEVALAARFVDAIDANSADILDPAYLAEARVFVTVEGSGLAGKDARRLASAIDGQRILGLPARVVAAGEAPKAASPSLHLGVTLTAGANGETRGKVVVQAAVGIGEPDWATLGQVSFRDAAGPAALDAATLAGDLDRAVIGGFVNARVSRRSATASTLRVENKLPFTLGRLTVKGGDSAGSSLSEIGSVGIGPNRSGLVSIPGTSGTIDRVGLNGL